MEMGFLGFILLSANLIIFGCRCDEEIPYNPGRRSGLDKLGFSGELDDTLSVRPRLVKNAHKNTPTAMGTIIKKTRPT